MEACLDLENIAPLEVFKKGSRIISRNKQRFISQ
jgi:hypothetical protein